MVRREARWVFVKTSSQPHEGRSSLNLGCALRHHSLIPHNTLRRSPSDDILLYWCELRLCNMIWGPEFLLQSPALQHDIIAQPDSEYLR
jgi:hypothetical protein